MQNLQTNLLDETVYLKADKMKSMNYPRYKVKAIFVENGLRLTISDEHGGLKTVAAEDAEIYISPRW